MNQKNKNIIRVVFKVIVLLFFSLKMHAQDIDLNSYPNNAEIAYSIIFEGNDLELFSTVKTLEAKGEYKKALRILDLMSDTYSNQYLIYDRMGIIHIKMQKYNKALRDFQKVIRLNSQYPEVFNHRGILNFTLGNYKLAKLDYDRAIKMDRDYAVAYYNRALLSLVLGNTEQAYKDLTIARGFNYLKATDIIEQFFVDK